MSGPISVDSFRRTLEYAGVAADELDRLAAAAELHRSTTGKFPRSFEEARQFAAAQTSSPTARAAMESALCTFVVYAHPEAAPLTFSEVADRIVHIDLRDDLLRAVQESRFVRLNRIVGEWINQPGFRRIVSVVVSAAFLVVTFANAPFFRSWLAVGSDRNDATAGTEQPSESELSSDDRTTVRAAISLGKALGQFLHKNDHKIDAAPVLTTLKEASELVGWNAAEASALGATYELDAALTASSGARWHGIPHVLLLRSRADPKRRIVVMGGFPPKVSLSSGSGQVIMFDGRTPP